MSKTKKLYRLRKAAMYTVCVYCGKKTPSKHPGHVDREAILAHMIECEARPEQRMLKYIMKLTAAVKYLRATLCSATTEEDIRQCLKETADVLEVDL